MPDKLHSFSFKAGFKRARNNSRYTQKTFAEEFNISIETVKNWEQGRNIPEIKTLEKLCDFFQCDLDYLFDNIEYRTHNIMADKLHNFSFKDGFKRARNNSGYTRKTFAEEFDISIKTVRNWEYGENIPEIKALEKLCDFFQCDLDYLFNNIECKTHDVQFIQDCTGLSEKAIEKLRATKTLHDCILSNPYLPYISTLFEQLDPTRYSDVVHEIAAYLRSDGLSKNMWYNVENRDMEYKEYNRGKDFNLPIPAGSDMFDNLLLMDIQEKLKTLKKQIKNKQTPDTN